MSRSIPRWIMVCAISAVMAESPRAEEVAPADWEETIRQLTRQVQVTFNPTEARRQLAVAHNNYAVDLVGRGEWELATQHLQAAIQLDRDASQFRKNLAGIHLSRAYEAYRRRQYEPAREAVQQALEADPELVQAHVLLGEIEYTTQHLKRAKAAWARALELDPTQQELATRLGQLEQELPVESEFDRLQQAYFDLRYEDQVERPVGFDVRSILRQARRLVGSDFSHWPRYKLVVLLYSAKSFRALRQETPEWLAGQYDGKIRLPLPGEGLDLELVKQILLHEYTHALVHDLAGGRCPTWFNEGLAEYEGARYGPRRTERLAEAVANHQLVPWSELDRHFSLDLPMEQVALAYQESHSIVRYLAERYGFWRIRNVLKAVGQGEWLERVMEREFRTPVDRLESRWRDWLPHFLSRQ